VAKLVIAACLDVFVDLDELDAGTLVDDELKGIEFDAE
jgi:hypothetical protein